MGEPRARGRFGEYGGRYAPESLVEACREVDEAFREAWAEPGFRGSLARLLAVHAGRPTPLTPALRLSEALGVRLYLKREDLTHTGSHKINNVLGQALLAVRMGRRRLIAETGAGQHGVATATAAALLGLEATVFMGERDIERQALNVFRMRMLGAEVVPVTAGSRTLKDATSEAMRHWVGATGDSHYCIGSVVGPDPYPWMVREFQRVIGEEARGQCAAELRTGVPDYVVACVGGGSNAAARSPDSPTPRRAWSVSRRRAEPGRPAAARRHARLPLAVPAGRRRADHPGALHRRRARLPGVGPEHAHLRDLGRARYVTVTDDEAVGAAVRLARTEGIVPALESAHALAWVIRAAGGGDLPAGSTVLMTLSGRGDKDVSTLKELL
nr:tryptophan synthase subunit beta [Planobispora longispora]